MGEAEVGGEQGFANQTEKNIYSNLGVMSKFRTHCLRLQVANTAKGGCRETVRFRECSFSSCEAIRYRVACGPCPKDFVLNPTTAFQFEITSFSYSLLIHGFRKQRGGL